MTFEPSLEEIEDPESHGRRLDRRPLLNLYREHFRRGRDEGVSMVERLAKLSRGGEHSESEEEGVGERRIDRRVVESHPFD